MYPTLIEIFGIEISMYGVMLAVAFLAGGWMFATSCERSGMSRDDAWRLVTWALVGGVVGSKIWFAAEIAARSPGVPLVQPLLSRGGLTWYGGLIGGAALAVWAGRRAGLTLVLTMNAAAPALAIGQAIGRIGCLLVGDCYGRPTDLPWGIAFPDGIDPISIPVHPTQLYECAWLGIGGLVLWLRRERSPFLFAEYLLLQGLGRLWLEVLRTNPPLVGPFTNAQIIALCCIVVGATTWARAFSRKPGGLDRAPRK